MTDIQSLDLELMLSRRAHSRRIERWYMTALLVMCLDGLTTAYALSFLDGAQEMNPILAALVGVAGVPGMAGAKILIGGFVCTLLAITAEKGHKHDWMNRNWRFKRISRERVQRNALRTLMLASALTGAVVINNAITIAIHS